MRPWAEAVAARVFVEFNRTSVEVMGEPNPTRTVEVTNPEGIHARAATMIAGLIRRSGLRVQMIKNHERIDGTDVLQILSLGARPGDRVSFEATGSDAERVLDALVRLVSDNFVDHEDERTNGDHEPH